MAAFNKAKASIPDTIEAKVKGTDNAMEMDKVNIQIYGDGVGARNSVEIVYCGGKGECSLFCKGKCMQYRRLFGSSDICKYGSVARIDGYSNRAASFSQFTSFYRSDPSYGALEKSGPFAMAEIAGEYCLSISPLRLAKDDDGRWKVVSESRITMDESRLSWIPTEDLTCEIVRDIIEAKPRDILGHAIESWKSENVPRFLDALEKMAPDVYKELCERFPEYTSIVRDHVGREAYLATLANGTKVRLDGNVWEVRDGKLYGKDIKVKRGLSSVIGRAAEVVVDVDERATIHIEDNSWVDGETEFTGD